MQRRGGPQRRRPANDDAPPAAQARDRRDVACGAARGCRLPAARPYAQPAMAWAVGLLYTTSGCVAAADTVTV